MPLHLTAIPLVINYNYKADWMLPHPSRLLNKELLLALQYCNRLYNIFIGCCSSEDPGLLQALDNAFPMLEALSLVNNDRYQVFLPNNFVAPRLRALHLIRFTIPMGHLSLTNATTNLLSLRLEDTGYFPPEYLVECIASMPHLEDMSLIFKKNTYDPNMLEWPRTQITRVVLPRFSRLKFIGIILYLDNLLARISTPFLQDFRFSVLLDESSTLAVLRMSAFLGTIQNLDFRTVVVTFNRSSLSITYHPEQAEGVPPYFSFNIDDRCPARAVASMVQICSANAPALPVVERLDLEANCYSPGFKTQHTLWYTLLRSFGGVKTLRTDILLATELSDVFDPHNEAVTNELLPRLSELVVVSEEDLLLQPFSSFIHARRLAGHPVDLRVVQSSLLWYPPRISWSFGTSAERRDL